MMCTCSSMYKELRTLLNIESLWFDFVVSFITKGAFFSRLCFKKELVVIVHPYARSKAL
jgi:hypothetical protein